MNKSVVIVDGVEHRFTPNPTMNGEEWKLDYPPIQTSAKWLMNKYTGELFPNTKEFCYHSDCLVPYHGEMTEDGFAHRETGAVNKALAHAEKMTSDDDIFAGLDDL